MAQSHAAPLSKVTRTISVTSSQTHKSKLPCFVALLEVVSLICLIDAGEMELEGVSVAQFTEVDESGQNPLQAAMKSSMASVMGVSESQIELVITEGGRRKGRRALSIQISFKIKIETSSMASTAVTALTDASASGGFAEEFKTQAAKRGEVVEVSSSVLESGCADCVEEVIIDVIDNSISDMVHNATRLMNLILVICWILVIAFATTAKVEDGETCVEGESSNALFISTDKKSPLDFPSFEDKLESPMARSLSDRDVDVSVVRTPRNSLKGSPRGSNKHSSGSDQPEQEVKHPFELDLGDKIILVFGLALAIVLLPCACFWLPTEAYAVLNNATNPMQCVAQNYAQLATSRVVSELTDTTQRNADMFTRGVITWTDVQTYAADVPATKAVYTSSLPAVLLGVLSSTSDLVSTWAVISSGEVFSAEWVSTSRKPVVKCSIQWTRNVGRQHTAPRQATVNGKRPLLAL